MTRERWMHLLLFGFAISVIIHASIMVRLWWVRLPGREERAAETIELALQQLPPQVEMPDESVALPDPTDAPAGPVSLDPEALPNLSMDAASDNPNADDIGAPEAPGVGAIAGNGGAGSALGIGSGSGGGGTSFFGVGGRGSRFAFVVDVSGSMEAEGRMTAAMAELKRSIAALPDYSQFYVVLFSSAPRIPEAGVRGWIRASRANIASVRSWIDEQGPTGGTDPTEALRMCFALPQAPDVIFLLTDGEIPPDTAFMIRQYRSQTRREPVINTIGFSSEAGKEPLIQIAEENRGIFRFVPTRGFGGGRP
jgi:hypothetical protein